jgi:hypothetical protein
VITGSAIDLTWEQPYYITAYNPKGSSTDTIYITIDNPTGTNAVKKASSGSPRLIGISGLQQQPQIYFLVPFSSEYTDIIFTIYNLQGAAITSSRVSAPVLGSGIQSVSVSCLKANKVVSGGLYFVEMKATNNRSGKHYTQRLKSMILR